MLFQDRRQAGQALAERLGYLRGHQVVVLGLPRGGIVVAREIADALAAPLDVLLTRKIELSGPPNTTLGAIGESGVLVSNHDAIHKCGLTPDELTQLAGRQRAELAKQVAVYRRTLRPVPITGQTVILVDDGIATGATAHAAVRVLRARAVGKIILAVPAGPRRTLDRLAREVDQLVCPRPLRWLHAVRHSYAEFAPVDDAEALALLAQEPQHA